MGETTTNTSGACELVLDYVYGELDEARKRTFEEHLPTCARCQQEVASFGRVRTAAKRVMPAVEPTAPLAGALHAQLMHAAAQRKPKRGVLLSFPRKIVEHPALSAAAMFVLVGGAIAINWSRGKMAMPATTQTAVSDEAAAKHAEATLDTPKPTEAAPVIPEPKAKEEAPANELAKAGDKSQLADDKASYELQTPKGSFAVSRPTAHRAVATAEAAKKGKVAAPASMKNIAVDGKKAKYDTNDALAQGAKDQDLNSGLGSVNGAAGGGGAVTGGVVGGETGRFGAKSSPAKSSAPAPADEAEGAVLAEKAPARKEQKPGAGQTRAYGSNATTTAPAAPPPPAPQPVAAAAPSAERDYRAAQSQHAQAPVAKPSANARSYDLARKQADEWATTGRCAEAIKSYEELQKANQYITPTERVYWVRCLTQSGRQEEAQQRLDELKAEKKVTNAQIEDAEKQLVEKRREANKKSKKAPAADRAPSVTSETVQQRAQEPAPAQASPPDSTHTKVKSTTSY
jgi:hypothetical protein